MYLLVFDNSSFFLLNTIKAPLNRKDACMRGTTFIHIFLDMHFITLTRSTNIPTSISGIFSRVSILIHSHQCFHLTIVSNQGIYKNFSFFEFNVQIINLFLEMYKLLMATSIYFYNRIYFSNICHDRIQMLYIAYTNR